MGAEVLGAGLLGAEVLGGGALGTVVVGGGCDGFGEFGRGNGCGVCAAAAVANSKLNTETRKH